MHLNYGTVKIHNHHHAVLQGAVSKTHCAETLTFIILRCY